MITKLSKHPITFLQEGKNWRTDLETFQTELFERGVAEPVEVYQTVQFQPLSSPTSSNYLAGTGNEANLHYCLVELPLGSGIWLSVQLERM